MTKAELIDVVTQNSSLPRKEVARTINLVFEQIAIALRRDKRFGISGFGTFSVRRHKARKGVNPRTLKPMRIPALRTIGFQPSPKLKKGI